MLYHIVVSLEGFSGGSSRRYGQHGSLDLQELSIIQVLSDLADHLSSRVENVSHLLIHNQVQVTHPVSLLLILESKVSLGEHVQTRCQQSHHTGCYGQLSCLCSTGMSLHSDDVTTAYQGMRLIEIVLLVAVILGVGHDLYLETITLHIVEHQSSAHRPDAYDSSRNRCGHRLQDDALLGALRIELILELLQCQFDIEFVGVRKTIHQMYTLYGSLVSFKPNKILLLFSKYCLGSRFSSSSFLFEDSKFASHNIAYPLWPSFRWALESEFAPSSRCLSIP